MMNLKRIVGLTGGMGAGKSTLVGLARRMGIPIYDVDAQVHQMYQNSQITGLIGSQLGLASPVTRQDVAQLMVKDPSRLPILESLILEQLDLDLRGRLMFQRDLEPFLLIDAPLLFEMRWNDRVDFVIAIQCPREIREKRVLARPNMTPEKMKLFMDRQIDEESRAQRSHFTVDNGGSLDSAEAELEGILLKLGSLYS